MTTLTLDYPPSTNRYWRNWRGRTVKSAEARSYQERAGWLAKAAGMREPLAGDVVLSIRLYRPQRRGDVDNYLKVMLDSLNGIAWHDDDQVVELHVYRHDDRKNPRVEIEVNEIG